MGVRDGKAGESPQSKAGRAAEPAHNRKPYQKPAFRFERVFETMALSCGKMVTTQFQCRFHRKTS
jgi:hypothetical protein